jgi:hypothetical protein
VENTTWAGRLAVVKRSLFVANFSVAVVGDRGPQLGIVSFVLACYVIVESATSLLPLLRHSWGHF